ncbi:DNA mismatch repair protein MutS [Aerococcaceae bacterium NML191292]|nr:DNA mismatch repair protein MutS [Aerococcaceae bacterium NML191292]MCW6667459.1 DNA mismatch repair protein MutS [Aerococcaceae bacterium NML190938]
MAEAKLTPMMVQYLSMKEQYPDAFLFFRLGDFYEMFNEDALEAAKILEITLTSRNKNAENPTPMCGVPYHSAKDYIRRLIEAGHKVAICEQVEDPKQTKGMVRREVVRVITPGTVLDEDALPMKENNYLAVVHFEKSHYTLGFVDVSTGDIRLTQTADWHQCINEIQSMRPTELLVSTKFPAPLLNQLQQQVTTHFSVHEVTAIDAQWQLTDANEDEQQLLQLLFSYLFSVQKQAVHHMKPVERYELSQYLQMNQYAKMQLELTRSLRTQRKKGSLLWLIDHTKTAMGGRLLHQWLEKPLLSHQALTKRHDKVELLLQHYFERIDIMTTLERIYDLERLVTKISLGTANARDIDQLRTSLRQIPFLNQLLQQVNEQALLPEATFDVLPTFQALLTHIDDVLAEDPPISVTEGNIIRSGYDEELDKYRDALSNGQQWLAELQQRERERTGLKTLKVSYNKVFGYYIEISRLQAASLNDERYQRKQTLSNAERFITDELKELETIILGAQDNAMNLEYRLFVELREYVGQFVANLQALATQVAELDVLCNFAALSEEEGYTRANLTMQAHEFKLRDSRHPAVEKLIGKSAFVPNDLDITPQQSLLLLTGPNMSGKSTYMRQVAFCVILNQIGCFVPAREATLPLVDKIFTRIGSSDDIASGQSTFMVEMMETNYALEQATPNSLLLFDEIGRGTATFDGMALAEAILYYIANHVQAATIFSTHYHELTELEDKLPVLRNIHVGATEQAGEVVFLHKILEGPADKSYGIHVAKLAGLPRPLIEQSRDILEELERNAKWLREPNNQQMSLFDLPGESQQQEMPHPVITQLKELDVNQLTPLAALQMLADLQKQV